MTFNDKAVLAIGVGVILGGITGLYGIETTQRTWFFFLPVVAYFTPKFLDLRGAAIALCVLLLASLPLHFIAHYGNQAADYVSPSQAAGIEINNKLRQAGHYPLANLYKAGWEDDQLVFGNISPSAEHYLPISQADNATFRFLWNRPDFVGDVLGWLDNSERYNLVYVNPEFNLYINENRSSPDR